MNLGVNISFGLLSAPTFYISNLTLRKPNFWSKIKIYSFRIPNYRGDIPPKGQSLVPDRYMVICISTLCPPPDGVYVVRKDRVSETRFS